jgi:hypothetical protein
MSRLTPFAFALLLLFAADDTRVMPWQKTTAPQPDALAGATIPVLPDLTPAGSSQPPEQNQSDQAPGPSQAAAKNGPLQQSSELALIRYVDGEFAHAVRSIPTGKDGFVIYPGKPIDQAMLRRLLASHGAAMNPGDSVQITALQFKKTRIYVLLNGGGKGHSSWRDRLQLGVSGIPTASVTPNDNGPDRAAAGSTLILDFNGPIPDMTPDGLKGMLGSVLDFSHERSAAILWTQSLPPQMQKAIAEKRAVVGMTREMVEAAIGKPDKKVREKNADGEDTEDWIYGQPPAITLFVTFIGDKVSRVEQFPKEHASS